MRCQKLMLFFPIPIFSLSLTFCLKRKFPHFNSMCTKNNFNLLPTIRKDNLKYYSGCEIICCMQSWVTVKSHTLSCSIFFIILKQPFLVFDAGTKTNSLTSLFFIFLSLLNKIPFENPFSRKFFLCSSTKRKSNENENQSQNMMLKLIPNVTVYM